MFLNNQSCSCNFAKINPPLVPPKKILLSCFSDYNGYSDIKEKKN